MSELYVADIESMFIGMRKYLLQTDNERAQEPYPHSPAQQLDTTVK